MNTIGQLFRLTTAGESHGPAMVGIVDGMPAGIEIDMNFINRCVSQRRTAYNPAVKGMRCEADEVRLLSGVFEGVSTGTPIAFMIENGDARSSDYDALRHVYRPSHADFTYDAKYGRRDFRGGGRASARETVLRVVAGALAQLALARKGVSVYAYTYSVGREVVTLPLEQLDLQHVYDDAMRCPQPDVAARIADLIQQVRQEGDTIGGIVGGVIEGLPVGLGQPIYGKFQAMLASAMMSINAAKGFDYGMGFDGVGCRGSEMNDRFVRDASGIITTATNHSGGIQGGITNGRPVNFRVAFKPVATLMRDMPAITDSGEEITINPGGRHDSCVVPRAVPVVQAMAAITTLDAMLLAGKY